MKSSKMLENIKKAIIGKITTKKYFWNFIEIIFRGIGNFNFLIGF